MVPTKEPLATTTPLSVTVVAVLSHPLIPKSATMTTGSTATSLTAPAMVNHVSPREAAVKPSPQAMDSSLTVMETPKGATKPNIWATLNNHIAMETLRAAVFPPTVTLPVKALGVRPETTTTTLGTARALTAGLQQTWVGRATMGTSSVTVATLTRVSI